MELQRNTPLCVFQPTQRCHYKNKFHSWVNSETNSLQRAANARVSLPCQRKVKKSKELSQGGLIHDIHHTHFCDQEVQDTAPGGHLKHTQTQQWQK